MNSFYVNIFIVHIQIIHMKKSRLKKENTIPVSQNQLAFYLGIKPSALSMANSSKYARQLPTGKSEKLTSLYRDFELMKFEPKVEGPSSVRIKASFEKSFKQEYKKLEKEIAYLEAQAGHLKRKLGEMCKVFTRDMRWLNVIDDRLRLSPTKNDRTWLSYQQVITIERIQKNGIFAQTRLQLSIDLATSKANVYRNICQTLMNAAE